MSFKTITNPIVKDLAEQLPKRFVVTQISTHTYEPFLLIFEKTKEVVLYAVYCYADDLQSSPLERIVTDVTLGEVIKLLEGILLGLKHAPKIN